MRKAVTRASDFWEYRDTRLVFLRKFEMMQFKEFSHGKVLENWSMR